MADDAEWVDVDSEFGVKPSNNPRRPTDRPFWATPIRPRNPPRDRPVSRIPYNPRTTPYTPHDAPEVLAPRQDGTSHEVLAVTMGLLGGLMGILLIGLVVYMFVLRRRLKKAKSERAREDYSIRVTDIAHLSSTLDDSAQIYANTSDLHKLMNSARVSRKNPPPIPPSSGNPRPAAPLPQTYEPNVSVLKPKSRKDSVTDAADSMVSSMRRLSTKIGNNISIPNLLSQIKKTENHQRSTETVLSIPEVVNAGVPEFLDDDDLWSEDSFDSCSIGYEEENNFPVRVASTRRSSRSANKIRVSHKTTAVKPSIPPPAPPSNETVYGNITPELPFNAKPVGIVRPAPPAPGSSSSGQSSLNSNFDIVKPTVDSSKKPAKISPPPLPSISKPTKPKDTAMKPPPPVTPKPAIKPHLLPKLKIGLTPPKSNQGMTPDTTTTLLSSTPCLEETIRLNARSKSNSPLPKTLTRKDSFEPSNLTVSARKALLEGKNILPH